MKIIRIGMVAVALVVVVTALRDGAHERRCHRLGAAAYVAGLAKDAGAGRSAEAALLRGCPRGPLLGKASIALINLSDPRPAERLARAAVRVEPDGLLGWIALTLTRRRAGDRAGERAARARVKAIDPFYVVPG